MKITTNNHPFGNTSLINWFFDDVLTKDAFNTGRTSHSVLSAMNRPGMNIVDSDSEFTLEIAAPGLNKEDFSIDVKHGAIHVSANKNSEEKKETKNYKSREFNYSCFKRSFRLPEHIDSEKISAEYVNGVLQITIPKTEAAKNGLSIMIR